jgi:pimeloyl-ACP methyl ester carboxylesterase
MNVTKKDHLKVPGASLYYEIQGSGPVLLMIPGGPADATIYAGIAPRLSDRYTVVTYDPRGLSRSQIDMVPEDQRIVEIMASDAHHLLAAVGSEPAFVFGNSAGAIIGLDLVTRHPQQVQTLIAHEPPATPLLPDGSALQAAFQGVYGTYRSLGIDPAWQQFLTLVDTPPTRQKSLTDAEPADGPQLAPIIPEMEEMAQMQRNLEFFFAHYLRAIINYQPDIDALLTGSSRVVAAVGEMSAGQMAHRGAVGLAERLGTQAVVFPGGHGGFLTDPEAFAATLHQVLLAKRAA